MRPNGAEITRKIFRKLISTMLTIQSKIMKIMNSKANGMEILGKKFLKIWYTSQGCHLF